jgi:ABC-type sugar transport system ATPase subunit
MLYLKIQHLRLNLPGNVPVLDDINLNIKKGEIFGIIGPSGCGKTMLLKTIAGLFNPAEGAIYKDGNDITKTKPNARGVSMVFQDFVLYPHMTNLNNLRYPLILKKSHLKPPISLAMLSRLLHIEEKKLLDKFPRCTSLGERQRVSIGKALTSNPDILLLDEPISNVEDSLRNEIRHSLRNLVRDNGITVVYVSHNQTEIAEISDNIAVMKDGRIEQTGTYTELYDNPATLFVSTLIGEKSPNLLTKEEVGMLTGGKIKYALTIRPGECSLEKAEESIKIEGEVSFIESLIQEGKKIVFINKEGELFGVELDLKYPVDKGDYIKIYIPVTKARFFEDAEASGTQARVYNLW